MNIFIPKTKRPNNIQKAIIVRGSIRIALLDSSSKYRTSPADDIRPPVFSPLSAILGYMYKYN